MDNFKNLGYYERVKDIIDNLELKNKSDNDIIKNRFLYEVLLYEQKRDKTKKYYNAFRFIVTVGSIFLPAILSIGQMDPAKLPKNFDAISYWASWTISLTVTACNGFLQLFSLDKNYFTYSIVTEQLKTEGWQYLQLSGKYEESPSHEAAFKTFCKSIENIKRKQIEQEFTGGKAGDKKKNFNFQKEMKNTVPQQYQITNNTKDNLVLPKRDMQQIDMNEKLQLLDTMMKNVQPNISEQIASKVDDSKVNAEKVVKETATEIINDSVEKALKKENDNV